MKKRRPPPPEPHHHLTPADVIANALTAAGLPPRPAGPGVRHFRLNSPEGEEALHDPRKREFGYVPLMVRPRVADEEAIVSRPEEAVERKLMRSRPMLR